MYRNNLTREYTNHQNNNTPFVNNPMLSNNQYYQNSVRDPFFLQRINAAKMEQMKKVKNRKDLDMTDDELGKILLNQIKIEKMSKEEKNQLMEEYNKNDSTYTSLKSYSTETKDGKKNAVSTNTIPKAILELWEKRTNNPYKRVLHKLGIDDYTKKYYKDKDDLIIHKTTKLQKKADIKRLKKELAKLDEIFEKHNSELKAVYCLEKKHKFLEEFEYANKYKNRIKYDPKNCTELKELYKKEQKKLSRESKHIDKMLNMILAADELSKEEIDDFKKTQDDEDKASDEYKKSIESLEKEDMKKIKKELNDDKTMKKELIKQFGKDGYKQVMDELENDIDSKEKPRKSKHSDSQEDTPSVSKTMNKVNADDIKEKYKKRRVGTAEEDSPNTTETQPKKKRIMLVTEDSPTETNTDTSKESKSSSSQALIDKYKNRRQ
jgi:hypothetical protein